MRRIQLEKPQGTLDRLEIKACIKELEWALDRMTQTSGIFKRISARKMNRIAQVS
jgi:hypothetical protein